MGKLGLRLGVAFLLSAGCALAAADEKTLDLRRAVPEDAYLAVHGRRDPKRDFQRKYFEEVWKTVQETKIVERTAKILTSRMSPSDLQKAEDILAELKQAAKPIPTAEILNCKEIVYWQVMEVPAGETKTSMTSQHVLLFRLPPQAVAQTQEGIKNLFEVAEKHFEGKVAVRTSEEEEAAIVGLSLPAGVPFSPTVIRVKDVLIVSSSEPLARRSLGMLLHGGSPSKFDDPRLKEALRRLPAPEDGLVFYDGKQQVAQLRKLVEFLRRVAQNEPNAKRVADLLDGFFDELAIFDFEASVEYTEGNLNRSAAYGKTLPGAEDKLLAKVFASGKPFEHWQTWVPAEATAYWLTTGANLHPLYERVIAVISEQFPEAKPGLERFEQLQSQWVVDLDTDILQAFSGECVSITLPSAASSPFGGGNSVLAMRCQKPERIRELLHRLVDWLKDRPLLKTQQLALVECADLKGFDEVSAVFLAAFGAKPVIGLRDGWMFIASNAQAVKTVLAARDGKGPTALETRTFQQFKLPIKGPVYSLSYTNLAEGIHHAAALLNQAGAVLPMVIGLVGGKADSEALKPVQEVVELLPSVGRIVNKFDFFEARLSLLQAGDEPGSYMRQSVTVVRPASGHEESKSE